MNRPVLTQDAAGLLARLQSRPLLALAPHPDDLALSAGGLIRLLPGAELHLLTVFTRSRWAPLLAGHQPDTAAVSAARDAEDAHYAASVAAITHHRGGLPDSSARGVPEHARMRPPAPGDPLLDRVGAVLAAVLGTGGRWGVLCPLALGGHVDHLLVRDAALAVADRARELVFYEDLPYAADLDRAEIAQHARSVDAHARPVLVDVGAALEQKLADVRLYATQARRLELTAVRAHARRTAAGPDGAAERVWTRDQPGTTR